VVKVAEGPSLWQDNDLRCFKANLVSGRVKPVNLTDYMYPDNRVLES